MGNSGLLGNWMLLLCSSKGQNLLSARKNSSVHQAYADTIVPDKNYFFAAVTPMAMALALKWALALS